jgi:threonine dehydrogenase-like Zn-dependent dehydrogenase
MRRLMAMVENRRVDLSPLVTHRFPLDRIEDAIDLFASQREGVMKVALLPAPAQPERELMAGAVADEIC